MKKTLTLLSLLWTFHANSQYQFLNYFDNDTIPQGFYLIVPQLDTSAGNVWQIGPPNKSFFNDPLSAPNVLVTDTALLYPINSSSSVSFNIDPSPGSSIFAIRWAQKLDLEYGKDFGVLEFSMDNGITWLNAFDNPYVYNFYGFDISNVDTMPNGLKAFTGTDTTWNDIWLCFQLFNPLSFRYTLISDSIQTNQNGWMIDNLQGYSTFIHTVSESGNQKYLKVFPVPTDNIIHVEAQKLKEFHIIESMEFIGLDGRVLKVWKNIPTKFFFSTSEYPNGNYYVKVKTNKATEVFSVEVKHSK